uniref:Serpentine Receptor, class H n=1 Tax=Panagrolaimus davidi TaxID=227884 RepID=A0A914PN70_9BILA
MGEYRWYLCHQLFWSYAFDLFLSLWKPIPLWPFYLGYSGGILNGIPSKFSSLPLIVMFVLSTGMGFSIGISLFHRYVQASPMSKYFQEYSILWRRILVYAIIFILLLCGICIPIAYNIEDAKIVRASIESQNVDMKVIFERESSITGYDPALNGNESAIFCLILILILIIVILCLIILYFNFLRILSKNKSNLSAATFKLQRILFKALYLQMVFTLILLIFPILSTFILIMYGIKWSSKFSICVLMLTSIHAIADFAVMTFFVKPYRIFIISLTKKILTKIGFKFKVTTVTPLVISTTGSSTPAIEHFIRNERNNMNL